MMLTHCNTAALATGHRRASLACVVRCQAGRQQDGSVAASRRHLLGVALGLGVLGLAQGAKAAQLADLIKPLGAALDEDRDGVLSVEELRNIARRTSGEQMARQTIRERVVPVIDFDGDGVVSVEEFNRAMALELPVNDDVWAMIDQDRDGYFTLAELRSALGDLGSNGDAVLRASFELSGGDKAQRLARAQLDKTLDFVATGVLGDFGDA